MSDILVCGRSTRFEETVNTSSRRLIRDTSSGEVYGKYFTPKATNDLLRIKNGLLALTQLIALPLIIRTGYRIRALLTGNWIENGKIAATQKWDKQRYEALKSNKIDEMETDKDWNLRVIKESSFQLVKDIIKLVALPFASVTILFTSLTIGMVSPLHGRVIIANIEHSLSINMAPSLDRVEDNQNNFAFLYSHEFYCNYHALCFQTANRWEKQNLFRIFGDYSPLTSNSRLLILENLIEKHSHYFHDTNINALITSLRADRKKHTDTGDAKEVRLINRKALCNEIQNINNKLAKLHEKALQVVEEGRFNALNSQNPSNDENCEARRKLIRLIENYS